MRRWLLEPHVRRWWDDGVHDPYPDAELDHYRDAIRGLDRTYRYVAWLGDRPIGMLQHYLIDDHSDYARTLALGERAVGVDLFIGEADLIGRGHGPAMLRQFLRDGALPCHGTDVGVGNQRSIAWGIAAAFQREGARLAFTYLNERFKDNVTKLVETLPGHQEMPVIACDAAKAEDVDRLMSEIDARWKGLDILIHSIAFAPAEDLRGRFHEISRDGVLTAVDISAYTLVSLARRALPLFE